MQGTASHFDSLDIELDPLSAAVAANPFPLESQLNFIRSSTAMGSADSWCEESASALPEAEVFNSFNVRRREPVLAVRRTPRGPADCGTGSTFVNLLFFPRWARSARIGFGRRMGLGQGRLNVHGRTPPDRRPLRVMRPTIIFFTNLLHTPRRVSITGAASEISDLKFEINQTPSRASLAVMSAATDAGDSDRPHLFNFEFPPRSSASSAVKHFFNFERLPMHLPSAWKTSEFWLTFLMITLAAVVSLMPLDDVSLSLRIVAVLTACVGLCVYTRSRAATRITLIASRAHRTPPQTQSLETKWCLSNIAKPSLNLILLGVLGCVMLGALGACSPTSAYVAADQATFNAVAPEYENYVHADPNLTADQKSRRDRTVQTWQMRIRQSGVTVTPATQPTTQP